MWGGGAGGLVGRDAELDVLRGLVAELVTGRGGVVWVDGEPGIGKSELVDAAVEGVEAAGVRLFRAAADELTPVVRAAAGRGLSRRGPGGRGGG